MTGAQFYVDGWPGLAVCRIRALAAAHGATAVRNGTPSITGNVDPMRMVANRRFQAELLPKKEKLRIDPYDNQSGEIERVSFPTFPLPVAMWTPI